MLCELRRKIEDGLRGADDIAEVFVIVRGSLLSVSTFLRISTFMRVPCQVLLNIHLTVG